MLSTFQRDVGSGTLVLKTGVLAQQANGSVLVTYGDCAVLVTATMDNPREGIDFFPLTIDFEERLYARGKIPRNYFRREGRPPTEHVLADRLTDRSVRPLFPDGFRKEVQVIATPLSADVENPLDMLVMIGTSAALSISDIPFDGPIGATRIGRVDGQYVVNPTYEQLEKSELELVVSGSRDGIVMIEAGANELSEPMVLEAMQLAQDVNLELIELQEDMAREIGRTKAGFEIEGLPTDLVAAVESAVGDKLASVLDAQGEKPDVEDRLASLKKEVMESLGETYAPPAVSSAFKAQVESASKNAFREAIISRGERPDGRSLTEIRPISSEVGLLPRTHGSGLFTRGETQILGIATLGSVSDAQRMDTLSPQESKRFILHYNFPPFSTGEAKRITPPGRREVGHGALAERALVPVLPDVEDFPYTIRLVAEALSSNGSTSMGSVCAGTLALMDAGVPISKPVAGISIGLVAEENGNYATLTDIQGMEDHAGDMDFKVAGTRDGITAIQLDIKIRSLSFEIIEAALKQAEEGRMFLLDRMNEAIGTPRDDVSQYAPRMTRISVPVDKIGLVIGPGGKTIRGIVDETGATVDVEDDGTITIGATDGEAAKKAVAMIENLTREAKVGEIYTGKVVRIMDFGAFVEILPGKDGMVHISELSNEHVPTVEDVVKLGEEITVMVQDVDPTGRIRLSRRALLEGSEGGGSQPAGESGGDRRPGGYRQGNGRPGGGQQGGYRQGDRPQGGGRGGPGRGGPRGGGGGPPRHRSGPPPR